MVTSHRKGNRGNRASPWELKCYSAIIKQTTSAHADRIVEMVGRTYESRTRLARHPNQPGLASGPSAFRPQPPRNEPQLRRNPPRRSRSEQWRRRNPRRDTHACCFVYRSPFDLFGEEKCRKGEAYRPFWQGLDPSPKTTAALLGHLPTCRIPHSGNNPLSAVQ